MDDPQALTALIAVLVSAIVSIATARWTLASERKKLLADARALQQNLLKEVLGRRMDAYAALWKVITTYNLNWFLEGNVADGRWSGEFLRELNACNSEHGAFFSQVVYERFVEFRACLVSIETGVRRGEAISDDDLRRLERIAVGSEQKLGLATAIKDDLGSYISIFIRAGASPTGGWQAAYLGMQPQTW